MRAAVQRVHYRPCRRRPAACRRRPLRPPFPCTGRSHVGLACHRLWQLFAAERFGSARIMVLDASSLQVRHTRVQVAARCPQCLAGAYAATLGCCHHAPPAAVLVARAASLQLPDVPALHHPPEQRHPAGAWCWPARLPGRARRRSGLAVDARRCGGIRPRWGLRWPGRTPSH